MVSTHRSTFAAGEVIERQVYRAAPAVTRLGGHISLCEHLGPLDVRIVPELRPAILRLLRPAHETVDGALGTVPVPEQQAEAEGRGLFPRSLQGRTQCRRPDDPVCQVPVDRLA